MFNARVERVNAVTNLMPSVFVPYCRLIAVGRSDSRGTVRHAYNVTLAPQSARARVCMTTCTELALRDGRLEGET
jgi:hypothetical protein